MSDRLNQIGRVLKTVAVQAGALAAIVAIDHTVRTFITHKFKQYTKRNDPKNDPKIEVKQVETPAVETIIPPQTQDKDDTKSSS